MSLSNTQSTLEGLLKEVYTDSVRDLFPDHNILTKYVPFSKKNALGNKFHVPVVLTTEQGYTPLGENAGFADLNSSVAATMKDAFISGSSAMAAATVAYDILHASSNSRASFEQAFDRIVKNLVTSASKRTEMEMLYGRSGLAKAASSSNVDTTHTTITVKSNTWATGIWTGSVNMPLNFYYSGSLISSGADAVFIITKVDVANKKITVSGTATGITALDTAIAAHANAVDFYQQGGYSTEMYGLSYIMSNTGSLFGIDAGTYDLWCANQISTSGQLTQAKILNAAAVADQRSEASDKIILVNTGVFQNLATDQAALRMYDSSFGQKAMNGFKTVEFAHGGGVVRVVGHPMVKQGDAFLFNPEDLVRVGTTDWTFDVPGAEGRMLHHVAGKSGMEMRMFSNQAIMSERPAGCSIITGFDVV